MAIEDTFQITSSFTTRAIAQNSREKKEPKIPRVSNKIVTTLIERLQSDVDIEINPEESTKSYGQGDQKITSPITTKEEGNQYTLIDTEFRISIANYSPSRKKKPGAPKVMGGPIRHTSGVQVKIMYSGAYSTKAKEKVDKVKEIIHEVFAAKNTGPF